MTRKDSRENRYDTFTACIKLISNKFFFTENSRKHGFSLVSILFTSSTALLSEKQRGKNLIQCSLILF